MQPPHSRTDAQQQADDVNAFRRELARLERDGILKLTGDQRLAVDEHHRVVLEALSKSHDVDRDVRAKQLSLGMRVTSFLGALALAASVFFLFHQFWGLLRTPVQVAILTTASLASLALTALLRRQDGAGYFTKLAALVAFACFVLNVSMIGSIFNITPSDRALVPWAAYAFLLAYACDLRLLLAAGILCAMAFIAARAGEWGGLYWLDFGERPENFLPAALVTFALPAAIRQERFGGFAATYRVFGLLALVLPVLVLALVGVLSYLDLDPRAIEHGYQLFGFALSAGAIWLGARAGWADTVNTGITFFVIFLYTKFYDWWWESLPKYLFFLLLGLTALLALFVLRRLRTEHAATAAGGTS